MSTNPWSDDFYSQKELGKLSELVTEFRRTGDPSAAQRLELKMSNRVPFDEIVVKGAPQLANAYIRPETHIDITLLELPARSGPKSSRAVWLEFASIVSDTEYEVLDSLTRDEMIQLLVDRGIINED